MQITVDTATASALQLTALAAFIGELAVLARGSAAVPVAKLPKPLAAEAATLQYAIVKPEDNPAAGLDTAELFSKTPPIEPEVNTAAMFAQPNIPPLPQAAPAIVLDAEGLPWDERIHAGTKEKTAKGVWKARRNVNDAAAIQRVKSELLATMALPAGAPVQQTVPSPVFQQPQAVAAPPVAYTTGSAIQTQPIAPLTPPVPAPPKEPTSLGELMAQAGPLLASGQLAPDSLTTACQAIGLPSLTALAARPDLTSQVWHKLFGG